MKIPEAFVEQLIAALRRHGETGDIRTLGPMADLLELAGPPARRRSLPELYARWLRTAADARVALVDEIGRRRFGSNVVTDNADLVTDVDVKQGAISCCADGVFVIVCCPTCRALWMHCTAGHSWVDAATSPRKLERPRADKCPSCGTAMRLDDLAQLLASRAVAVAAGLERYLVAR